MADKPFDRERGLTDWLEGMELASLKDALAELAGGDARLLEVGVPPAGGARRQPLKLDWETVGFLESATADEQTLLALARLLEQLLHSTARYRMAADLHDEVVQSDFAEREYQATHDALTGLPNRNLLHDLLAQGMATARRHGQKVAVLFIGLDQFKVVNDSLGHAAGDRLLKELAARLASCVREGDTVARQGGDEFVLVVNDMAREEDVGAVSHKVAEALAQPFHIDGQEMVVTCSTGIALYPRDGEDAATLLKHADIALNRAKETGRNSSQYFAGEMNTRALERLTLESALRHAVERGELRLHYQPQLDLADGRVIGAEALVRWQHPEGGLVPPVRFIPVAEETGLILPIGEWVLRTACVQTRAWREAGFHDLRVAVNLSARQFRQQDVVGLVVGVLAETGLDPAGLELELTESLLVHNVEAGIEILRALSEKGVQLAIDDFGTGYSSLNYLKRFPIDRLKIDQSFVRDITSDPEDAAIVSAIVSLSHSLGLKVIAEGVETEAQLAFLRRHGCDEMQGYYFSRPVPAEEMEGLLRQGRGLAPAAAAAAPGQRTLLLVDDEAGALEALARVLGRDGYHILKASGGGQALDLLAAHEVGVIISDQRMPEMSGVEFLRRAQRIHPDAVRIVLSGYTELAEVAEAVNRGTAYKALTKPWDDDPLRANVEEAFQRHELARENSRLAAELERARLELEMRGMGSEKNA